MPLTRDEAEKVAGNIADEYGFRDVRRRAFIESAMSIFETASEDDEPDPEAISLLADPVADRALDDWMHIVWARRPTIN